MCVLQILAAAHEAQASRRGLNGGGLSQPELFSVLARLEPLEQAWVAWYLWGDLNAKSLLWGWAYQHVVKKSIAENWDGKFKRKLIWGKLAEVVVEELRLSPDEQFMNLDIAYRLNMHRGTFHGDWSERHDWLLSEGWNLADRATARLKVEMYG
jgi:hypothetical protein